MAVDLIEGWEPLAAGNVGTVATGYGWFFSSTSSVTIDGANARNGSKCFNLPSNNARYAQFDLTPANIRTLGFAHKFTGALSASSTGSNAIGGVLTSGGNNVHLRFTSTGNLQVMVGSTAIDTGTEIYSAGVYYFFEMFVNGSTGAFEVRAPNETITGNLGISGQTVDSVVMGKTNTAAGAPTQRYYDDIYCNDDGTFFGDCAADYRFPTSDGTAQDWTPASGVDGYAMIDNVPVNGAEYVEATTAADASDFGFSAMGVTAYQVHAVMLAVNWLRTGATAETARTRVNVGGTSYNGAAETVPQTTAEWVRQYWTNNPDTAAPWTPAEVQSTFDAGLERVS